MKPAEQERIGAEQFYFFLQRSLGKVKSKDEFLVESKDEFLMDIIITMRKYIRESFINFLNQGE